jgi:hypothetical protein
VLKKLEQTFRAAKFMQEMDASIKLDASNAAEIYTLRGNI